MDPDFAWSGVDLDGGFWWLTDGCGRGPGASMSISSGLEQIAYAILKGDAWTLLWIAGRKDARNVFGKTLVQGFFGVSVDRLS